MKKIYLLILLGLLSVVKAYPNVNLTAPTKNNFCLNTYAGIGNIVIDEGNNNDFQVGSNYIFISAPAGFEFDVTKGNLNESGNDVNAIGWLFRTPGVFGISYGVVGVADDNVLTISGLELRATSLTSGILRFETGSTNIAGMNVGTTTMATVSTGLTAISFTAVTPKCSNDANFGLGGSHTLSGGTTLNSSGYSSSPVGGAVSGTNFRPGNAGAGSHVVTYTVNTSGGCAFTTNITIDVNAAPIVTLTWEETSGATNNDARICAGTDILFTGYGANSYKFFNGATQVSTASTWNATGLTNGAVISVEGTATNGCKDFSPNKTVVVDALPGAPQFSPTFTTYGITDPAFWLDTLGTATEEANRSPSDPSYFTGPGVVYQSNRFFFYPNVAGNGTHTIVYHFVNPTTKCESTTSKSFTVGTGVSAGNIQSLNSQYCTYAAVDNIYIDFCESCFFTCSYYGGMQYSSDGGASWVNMTPTSSTQISTNCGPFGGNYEYRYNYNLNPATLGAGIKLFRYYYQATDFFFGGYSTYYSSTQSTTINGAPTISITNAFNAVTCSNTPNTLLTYTAGGASGVAVFSSTTTNFILHTAPDYFVRWNNGSSTDNATNNTITLTFTDNVSGCVNTTNKVVQVADAPTAPTFYTGYPYTFCNTDYTYGYANGTPGYTYQWIKDLPSNSPTYTDNYYPNCCNISYFPRGVISADETYYIKRYKYLGCVSNASTGYDMIVKPPVSVNIGQYNTVCSNQQISLNKLQKGGPSVTQTWSTYPTNNVAGFDNVNASSPIYTLSPADIVANGVNFRVTTSDPDGPQGCYAVYKDTLVKINVLPVVTATSSAPVYCSDNGITLYASSNNPSALPITWYKGPVLGGDQTGIVSPTSLITAFNLTPSEKAGGNITFNIVSSDADGAGPCGATTASVAIQINPEVVVDAGLDEYSCGDANINLSGSAIQFGGTNNLNGYWTHGAWSSTLLGNSNPKNAVYSPTPSEAVSGGNNIFYLVSSDPDGAGPCSYKTDSKIVTINKEAFITADADYTACSDGIVALNCNPTGLATLTINWYKNAIGGPQTNIVTPTNVSTTYNLTPAEKSGGAITFWVETNDPDGPGATGPCTAVNEQIVVTINPEAVVDPGLPIFTCGSAGVPLTGTCTLFGGGNLAATWSKGGWNQPIAATTNPKNTTYTPSIVEAITGGAYTYTLTSADPDGGGPTGPCPIVAKTVTHTINRAPFVSAGIDSTYCSNTTPSLLAVRSGSATSVTWAKSAGSGTIGNISNDTTDYSVHPGDYASGLPLSIDFTATTNDPDDAGPCVPAVDVVRITLNPHLTVSAGSNITVCANQTVNLVGNVLIGGSNRVAPGVNTWKTFDGAGGFTQNGPSNFTGTYNPSGVITSSGVVIPGNGELGLGATLHTYLVSTDPDLGGPCKADSQSISIVINPLPITHFAVGTKVQYCTNDNVKTLEGNLGSTFAATGASATFSGGSYVAPAGFNYEFDPKKTRLAPINGVNGGIYPLTYTFKDNNGCINHEDTIIRIYPFPIIYFTASTRCQYDLVTFTDTTILNTSVFGGKVLHDSTDWRIDNVPTINSQVTTATFANYGIHTFHLDATSNSDFNGNPNTTTGGASINCYNSKDTSLVFGPYPDTKFSWSRPCSIDSVFFVDKTTIPLGYTDSITWNMNGAGNWKRRTPTSAISTADSLKPVYQYSAPGVYDVTLSAKTNIYGCVKDTTVEVFVVPTVNVTPSVPYATSFATTDKNWAPSGQNYSWDHGTPSGKHVINPGKNVWITNLTGDYNLKEYSTLNSPCFNFGVLDKPMMSLNLWTNTRNLAGAVLEATTGNNQPWVTIGQIGDGKSWYDTQGIVGLIGKSSSNPIAQGFSGEDTTGFELSRIGLSQYANEDSLVRFRITFGSSDVNDALNRKDGIAFDSIWVGNRSKVVLVEHFTNALSTPSIVANDTVNSFQSQRSGDMVSVHYHTSFPGTDNMNLKNPADPSSRVLYYGITGAPRTQVDGTEQYEEYGNTPEAIKLNSIDNKALENAKFTLDISSKKVGMNLNVKAQLVAKEIVTQDVVLNIAVVERNILGSIVGGNQTAYDWVLKKMLPDAAGSYISRTWAIGDTVKMSQDWNFALGDFYDTSKIEVIAFVQNFSSKDVYQAAKTTSTGNTSIPVITAVEVQNLEENLLIYPVPADNEINVLFGKDLLNDTQYTLSDDMGRTVEKGVVERGSRMLSFNSKKLASGMYYLSLEKEDGTKVNRKVVVIH